MSNNKNNINFILPKPTIKIPSPPGFSVSVSSSVETKNKRKEVMDMKLNRARDLVIGQGKSILMTIVSSFFMGRSMSLFTMFFYGFYAYNSFSSILNVNKAFKMLESPEYSLFMYKIGYILVSLISFGVILYRIYAMGLIPLNPADWVNLLDLSVPKSNFIDLN